MSCSLFASIVLNLEEGYSENITLANYGVLLILHLIVFLVALHKVDIADASVFVHLVSKHYLVTLSSSYRVAC